MSPPTFLETPRLFLRMICHEDVNNEYLSWLNDQEVLRYRGPKAFPSNMESLETYLENQGKSKDLILAICLKENKRHIGNISLSSILWVHRSADLAIMIGAKDLWGKGFGKEAIYAISRHAFENMGLHRLWAQSPNPAFNSLVKSLDWKHEGTRREAFFLDGNFVEIECWGILKREFKIRPDWDQKQ